MWTSRSCSAKTGKRASRNEACVYGHADVYKRQVVSRAAEQDMIVKAAAVGDYRPAETAAEKLKKGEGELTLALARNPDILAELCLLYTS